MSIEAFANKLNEIMPLMFKEFTKRLTKELHKSKITLPQFFVLEFLSREGGSKMTELAHFMNVTTAAMTGIVDRLVRDGYIERVYDKNDRRIIKVKLTNRGNALARKITECKRQMIVKTFEKISETDRGHYLRILSQINKILLEESDADK
ncbi:MAG: MarR family transcriptional regulator [Candidatus Omnitrophica bacterium]|jgi:DNA-binding MarR family transcriptional regulator|nr:MarR family transcriptional regulator [Candidatus Omnitrophota bacterium]